jgi:hypothetical protein
MIFSIVLSSVAFFPGLSLALDAASASHLVTFYASGSTACPGISGALEYDPRVLPNGKQVTLAIPKNEVLVITRVSVSQLGGHGIISGHEIDVSLLTGFQVAFSIATGSSNDNFEDDLLFPSGLVVEQGTPLCVQAHDATASANLSTVGGFAYGFFAPNK